jgi:hypothetical protein
VHKDAVNVLSAGRKAWWLLPPAAACYSTEPIAEWLAAGAGAGGAPGAACSLALAKTCSQRAGDALFVPAGWAHAVLNTATAIGVALEFPAITAAQN